VPGEKLKTKTLGGKDNGKHCFLLSLFVVQSNNKKNCSVRSSPSRRRTNAQNEVELFSSLASKRQASTIGLQCKKAAQTKHACFGNRLSALRKTKRGQTRRQKPKKVRQLTLLLFAYCLMTI